MRVISACNYDRYNYNRCYCSRHGTLIIRERYVAYVRISERQLFLFRADIENHNHEKISNKKILYLTSTLTGKRKREKKKRGERNLGK